MKTRQAKNEQNKVTSSPPRIIVTTGDPAGIGPDIALKAAAASLPACIAVIGDRAMLAERAVAFHKIAGVKIKIADYDQRAHRAGVLPVIHRPCRMPATPGQLNPANSEYVIGCIDAAVDLCRAREFDAMTTGPVNKAVINQAGISFRGHTEWIARRCGVPSPVMMLANDRMRVCLLTDHIPLAEVPRQITAQRLREAIDIIIAELRTRFNIARPRLGVCGVNPHAGEGGYLGSEETEIIVPTLDALRNQQTDAHIIGPISADTAFTSDRVASFDAVLAMYHDQGLPAIKTAGFGDTVNITLGLPIVRTSVDHGTAVELAGHFTACESSLNAAIAQACALSANKKFMTSGV